MKILAIESSTTFLSLCVYDGKKVLGEHHSMSHKTMSATIVPKIEQLLKKTKTPLAAVDGFTIGLGPGSFTSLRVGFSTIKALVLATGKPLVGISSLDAIAYGLKKPAHICVITDAKRNMVYTAVYKRTADQCERIGDYMLLTLEELLAYLQNGMIIVGDGVDLFRKDIAAYGKKKKIKFQFADKKFFLPTSKALAQLAMPRFINQKFDHPATIVPLYLYPEDCQIRKQ